MFRAHRPILRRIHTAVHTTIGSVAVLLGPPALYLVAGLGDCSLLFNNISVETQDQNSSKSSEFCT
jgi:hypothetical protein